MVNFRRYLISLLGLVASAISLAAASTAAEAGKVAISAIWLPGQAASTNEIFVAMGGAKSPQPLVVGGNNRGRELSIEANAGGRIQLVTRGAPTQGDTPTWLPLGEVVLPSDKASRYLLILAVAQGASVRGMAVADDVAAFPIGTVRLANLTGSPLMAKVGDHAASHASGFSAPIPYAVSAVAGATDAPTFPFALATAGGVFFNGRIDAWSGSRTLVLVVPNSVAGKDPTVKSLIDRPIPPAKPAK